MSDECPFCILESRVIDETLNMVLIESKFEVAEKGHYLIIPRNHIKSCFDFSISEWIEAKQLINKAKIIMITGGLYHDFNVGWNDGKYAGQTIMHAHIHIIGRKKGDVEDPRGGIRNVIPARGNYLK